MKRSLFSISKRVQTPKWTEAMERSAGTIALHGEAHLIEQLAMINLTESDLKLLKAYQPRIAENIESIVDAFYSKVVGLPRLRDLIVHNSTVERLRGTLRQHMIEMFDGRIDPAFVEKRMRIAGVHSRIGLQPQWYMGAFQNLQHTLISMIQAEPIPEDVAFALTNAVTKMFNFEQQLVLEAYERNNLEAKERQYELVKGEVKLQIGAISQELASLTEQTSASAEQLIASSNEVYAAFLKSADKAKLSQSLVFAGEEKVNELDAGMKAIHDSSMHMQQSVSRLTDSAQKIGSIASIVEEISSQIKLLSLNASIEAARAGEHGAGFSVVAAEVKKLAEGTNQAVEQIRELIEHSDVLTRQAGQVIGEIQRRIAAGQEEVGSAKSVFDRIRTALEDGLSELNKVEAEIDSLVHVIDEVGGATARIAGMAGGLNEATENL